MMRTRFNSILAVAAAALMACAYAASGPPDSGGIAMSKKNVSTMQYEAVATASGELVMESAELTMTFSGGASPPTTLVIPIDSTAFDSDGTQAHFTRAHGLGDVDLIYAVITRSTQGRGPCSRDLVTFIDHAAAADGTGAPDRKKLIFKGSNTAPSGNQTHAGDDLTKIELQYNPATWATMQV